jgi:anti-anti-sigma regulatory factor
MTALPKTASGRSNATLAVVRAEGHVDRSGIEACDYLLSVAGAEMRGAVVDLTAATHLDFRAVEILAARRTKLKARGLELAVAAGKEEVRHAIRVGAGAEIPVLVTMDEAMSFVRGDASMVVGAGAAKHRSR